MKVFVGFQKAQEEHADSFFPPEAGMPNMPWENTIIYSVT